MSHEINRPTLHRDGQRLDREEENRRRYNPDGCCPPQGFDEMDAGERWEE